MTPQQIDAMKLALEALKGLYISNFTMPNSPINIAITAIKEVLAEHAMREVQRLGQEIEQEPCVHAKNPKGCYRVRCQLGDKCVDDEMSFRTTPPQRKPLTDDLYNELLFAVGNKYPNETRHQTALRYILQAEKGDEKAAHGIKENT